MQEKAPLWHSWRHVAAYMYLFICFFDFVGMPVYYEIAHSPLSKSQLVSLVATMDSVNQVQAMNIISAEQRWEPLTLGETGLFHVAFGAILGVAAFSRTQERNASPRPGYFDPPPTEPYDGRYGSSHDAPPRQSRTKRRSNRTPNSADPFADPEDM